MKPEPISSQTEWSLPITWILLLAGISIFLGARYGWWWLGIFGAVYLAVAIASVAIRGRKDSEKKALLKTLQLPLYGLFHIESIEQSSIGGYLYDIVPDFEHTYDATQQREIITSMEAAISDPDLDFSEVVPDSPFSNDEIRTHLEETLKRLRSRE